MAIQMQKHVGNILKVLFFIEGNANKFFVEGITLAEHAKSAK
jgi:hypothetical protein